MIATTSFVVVTNDAFPPVRLKVPSLMLLLCREKSPNCTVLAFTGSEKDSVRTPLFMSSSSKERITGTMLSLTYTST